MHFHTTSWTVVLEAADSQGAHAGAALEGLMRAYWRPLYLLARLRGRNHHDAEDLVQAFFAAFLERRSVKRADRGRGRFRNFLQTAFQNFLLNELGRSRAQKRGGGTSALPLDELAGAAWEDALAAAPSDPDAAFDREWAGVLLDRATLTQREAWEAAGDGPEYAVLNRFLEHGGTAEAYAEVASLLGLSAANVKTRVHRLRAEFRRLLRDEVAATVTDPHEIDQELAHLRRALSA